MPEYQLTKEQPFSLFYLKYSFGDISTYRKFGMARADFEIYAYSPCNNIYFEALQVLTHYKHTHTYVRMHTNDEWMSKSPLAVLVKCLNIKVL